MTTACSPKEMPRWLAVLLLALISLGLYARSLGSDFVYDARSQILIDRFIHEPRHFLDVLTFRVMAMDVLDFDRPVHLFSMMLDATLWGERPFGFHLTSILLHSVSVVGVFLLAARLTRSNAAAFAGALLFAVHPVNCEAVAEPSYREDLLVTALALLGMLVCSRTVANWRMRWSWAVWALPLCCFLACGAKESGVATPFFLLAIAYVTRTESAGAACSRGAFRTMIAAAFAAVGVFLMLRFTLEPKNSMIWTEKPHLIATNYWEVLKVQVRIWAFYLWNLVWPTQLCADYSAWSIRGVPLPVATWAVIGAVLLQIWGSWRRPLILLGSLVFWTTLAPVSNFIPIFRPMADRFLYLPMVGVALILADLASLPRVGKSVRAFLLVVAVPFSVLTFERQAVWHDSVSLWRDTLARNPQSVTSAINLATALTQNGTTTEAISIAEQTVRFTQGKSAEPFAQLAFALARAGDTSRARRAMARAAELDPLYADPDQLVRALRWERKDADVLKELVNGLDRAR